MAQEASARQYVADASKHEKYILYSSPGLTLFAAAYAVGSVKLAERVARNYPTTLQYDAINTDPFGVEPKIGDKWVDTGPHVMVVNFGSTMGGYTGQDNEHPDTSNPYVMWGGTPYAHLMLPVAD